MSIDDVSAEYQKPETLIEPWTIPTIGYTTITLGMGAAIVNVHLALQKQEIAEVLKKELSAEQYKQSTVAQECQVKSRELYNEAAYDMIAIAAGAGLVLLSKLLKRAEPKDKYKIRLVK